MTLESKIIRANCNVCLGERKHFVLHEEIQSWDEEVDQGNMIYGTDTFRTLKCCGCDSVKLQHSSWFSEFHNGDGSPIVEISYFPPATSRQLPVWLNELRSIFSSDEKKYVAELLDEIYAALYNDSRRLATMGTRALLEYIMVSKVGDKGSFVQNLDAFQKDGFLSKLQRESIEPILEAGHAAIHRGFNPTNEDVNTVVEITESLVETTYIHSESALRLNKNVPRRKKYDKE